ncbi:hypothetical protein [Thauera sp. WH-1]|uniref:hypothetical protein n=1 Tax=Thauera sp. WH-1 TaxID=3398230 RepID=UPI0039FBF8AD
MSKREMSYRPLGENGPQVSAIRLGTMTFGQQNSEAGAHSQLDLALERGVNFIGRCRARGRRLPSMPRPAAA